MEQTFKYHVIITTKVIPQGFKIGLDYNQFSINRLLLKNDPKGITQMLQGIKLTNQQHFYLMYNLIPEGNFVYLGYVKKSVKTKEEEEDEIIFGKD